jgi:hypothetical protein
MGMTPDEFWDCTPREFFYKMEGFFDHQMFLQRQEWERVRWSTNLLWNIQVAPKSRMTPTEMLKFEWEKPKPSDTPPITKDELQKLIKQYDGNKSGS